MLKNILRLLLTRFYSKNESALVARQSLPDTPNYIDWSSSVVINENGAYIAPDDGYVVLSAKTSENSGVNLWGSLDVAAPTSSRVQAKVFCPCKKGTQINYFLWGGLHLARFYKFIGGGYHTLKEFLLQGGDLCLNSLLASLRRSFLEVKRNGWQSNPPQIRLTALAYPACQQQTSSTTQLRAMELSRLDRFNQQSPLLKFSLEKTDNLFWLQILVGPRPDLGLPDILRRVQKYVCCAVAEHSLITALSSTLSAVRLNLIGGAL